MNIAITNAYNYIIEKNISIKIIQNVKTSSEVCLYTL